MTRLLLQFQFEIYSWSEHGLGSWLCLDLRLCLDSLLLNTSTQSLHKLQQRQNVRLYVPLVDVPSFILFCVCENNDGSWCILQFDGRNVKSDPSVARQRRDRESEHLRAYLCTRSLDIMSQFMTVLRPNTSTDYY